VKERCILTFSLEPVAIPHAPLPGASSVLLFFPVLMGNEGIHFLVAFAPIRHTHTHTRMKACPKTQRAEWSMQGGYNGLGMDWANNRLATYTCIWWGDERTSKEGSFHKAEITWRVDRANERGVQAKKKDPYEWMNNGLIVGREMTGESKWWTIGTTGIV
jgi:hypothetical protein